MLCLHELRVATPETIRIELRRTIEQLLTLLDQQDDVLEGMQKLRGLLKSLPLPGDELGVATKRLCNAHRYLVSEELGAVRYELRSLAGSLCSDQQPEERPPPDPFTGVRSVGQEYLPKHVDTDRLDYRDPSLRQMG